VKAPGEVQAVEREVDELRRRAQSLVEELERRLHASVGQARETVHRVKDAVNLPLQLRQHPRAAGGLGAGLAIGAGVAVWFLVARRRRERRPLVRARRQVAGLRQIFADPERVLRHHEPIGRKVLAAVLAAAAAGLARALAQRFAATLSRPSLPPSQPTTVEVV
jgi:hypothetical protein